MHRVRIIGSGRAGGSLATALAGMGCVVDILHRTDDFSSSAHATDILVLAVPDGAIAEVSLRVDPVEGCPVLHLSGALGLDVLLSHARRGSMHPLVALPDATVGAKRLLGAWIAVAGDAAATTLATLLTDRTFPVPDDRRGLYHAAAAVASNHLVALFGQVERLSHEAGVPLAAFVDLAMGSLHNVADRGAAAALTGPVARGDWATVVLHLSSIGEPERELYLALSHAAARLAGRHWPESLR